MSLKTTKIHLIQLLEDSSNKVIALSGKWGTGKSHLWRDVKEASNDEKIKSSIYVSLFGLSNIDNIKLKLIQSAIASTDKNSAMWSQLNKAWDVTKKVFDNIKGLSVLSDIALLASPSMLKDKVIVIDDIERKHPNLSVDEVMGFIDEYTQQHDARIILILNSDQLADRVIWEKLREKVIDQELRLDTTPLEAFEIALQLAPSIYSTHLVKIIESLGITNIRIICKIIRALNRILSNRTDLTDAVLKRVIPSTVLLTAIHYKGIDDGPDLNFVLNFGASGSWEGFDKSEKEEDETSKRHAKWRSKLNEIGITAFGEYEKLVVDFLNSGMFNLVDIAIIIERFSSETEVLRFQGLANQLREHIIWHYKISVPELLSEAQVLAEKAHLVDPYIITNLHALISGLEGGSTVADLVVDNWIKSYFLIEKKEADFENFFGSSLHPRIKAELDRVNDIYQMSGSVVDVVKDIIQNSGWGTKEERIMNTVTASEIEAIIKSLEVSELKMFLSCFIHLCVKRGTYQKPFGNGIDQFLQACRTIYADKSNPRLNNLLKILFTASYLELEPTI